MRRMGFYHTVLCFTSILVPLKAIIISGNGQEQNKGIEMVFDPPEIYKIVENRDRLVFFNCTTAGKSIFNGTKNETYEVRITPLDRKIAIPYIGEEAPEEVNRSYKLSLRINPKRENAFKVRAVHVGRVMMSIRILEVQEESGNITTYSRQPITSKEYKVTVVRRNRLVDLVFNAAITGVALLNSLSVGCVSDIDSLKAQFKQPKALAIGSCCQFLIMPVLALGLAKVLSLNIDLAVGLLYVTCVPGGGIGYIMVTVVKGDKSLSVAMNFLSSVVPLGAAPMWVFIMSYLLPSSGESIPDFPLLKAEIWIVASCGAYMLGMVVRYFRPVGANAFLNWFIKPFLLLFIILFVTLGIYINMYMFDLVDGLALVAASLLNISAFAIAMGIAAAARQSQEYIKTIATETTIVNSMLALVTLRFCLSQPDADIASSIPIWVMFTSLMPFVLMLFFVKIYRFMAPRIRICKPRQYDATAQCDDKEEYTIE